MDITKRVNSTTRTEIDANGKPVTLKPEQKSGPCWVEREFTVPADWGNFEVGIFDGDSGKDDAGNVNQQGGICYDTST